MKREMRFHAVPHWPPVLRRRLHHDFVDKVVLKPGRKMLDLASGGSEGPLLITGFAVVIPPDHYRQHLLVNVDSRQNTAGDCCRFHRCFHLRVPVPFWPKRHGTGPKLSVTITRSARPRGSDARHPHLFLRIGPRSNTLAASPTPVPVDDLECRFDSNTIFITFLARLRALNTLEKRRVCSASQAHPGQAKAPA